MKRLLLFQKVHGPQLRGRKRLSFTARVLAATLRNGGHPAGSGGGSDDTPRTSWESGRPAMSSWRSAPQSLRQVALWVLPCRMNFSDADADAVAVKESSMGNGLSSVGQRV